MSVLDQWTKCRFCTGDIIAIDGAYKGGRGHVFTFYCIDSPTETHEPKIEQEGSSMATQESSTYIVSITLSTEDGELPADHEVEQMVENQMGGTLDDDTGLEAIDVTLIRNETTGREHSQMYDPIPEDDNTYLIRRYHQDERHPDHQMVVRTGLSLAEAKEHCENPATHGNYWFEGYEVEEHMDTDPSDPEQLI